MCGNDALDCSNDAFDAEMGVDAAKPESVVNLTGDRVAVLWAANAFLAAALAVFGSSLPVAVSSRLRRMLTAEQLRVSPTRLNRCKRSLRSLQPSGMPPLDMFPGLDGVLAVLFPAVGLQGDARPLQMLGAALAMGYMYQGPPFRSVGNCSCLLAYFQSHYLQAATYTACQVQTHG